jgi:hypothetical protein
MIGSAALHESNDCGCCEGVSARTPVPVENRPGLSAVTYRVGTHARFKGTMLARLSTSSLPALRSLTTRDDDDFSIALLDAWATIADVLTFYQERHANEFYLRTATERLSLLELARLIGYELRPGVAATTYLAFMVEDAPGSSGEAIIDVGVKVQSVPGPDEQPQTFETVEKIEARAEWNAMKPRLTEPQVLSTGMSLVFLAGVATNLEPGDRLLIATESGTEFRRIMSVVVDDTAQHTEIELDAGIEQPPSDADISEVGIFAFRTRASLFGYNAPDWRAMPLSVRRAYTGNDRPSFEDFPDWPFSDSIPPGLRQLDLDTVHPKIVPNSWVVVTPFPIFHPSPPPGTVVIARVLSVVETARSDYTMSAKVSRLRVDTVAAPIVFDALRKLTVYGQSEKLELAEAPLTSSVQGTQIELDAMYGDLGAGQIIMFSGELADQTGVLTSEVAVLKDVTDDEGRATLALVGGLAHEYKRDTVTINGNVALATHGATVQEVLGSGDASEPYQSFTLRQPPLTYVTAPTPRGAESTLQVRVNDLRWHEVPTLYGRGPNDRVFITRADDDGKTMVQFGDGLTGARLPTGQENVRASYRKGIGLGGRVEAEQLSMLLTRPLGVKEVINPLASDGADDPESRDEARHNAPMTLLTFDRVVSLQDYEDFARAYAGIAKALATWTWDGRRRGVFVTVAGPDGAEVKSDSKLHENLLVAMQKAGDPFVPLKVKSYRQALFRIGGSVKVDPDHQPERVLGAVEEALRSHFSFETRTFGQPVLLSEVIAVIHAVVGVVAVDLDKLNRTDAPAQTNLKRISFRKLFTGKPSFKRGSFRQLKFERKILEQLTLKHRLLAEMPMTGADGAMAAAELLTLDPAPLALGVMS